MIEDAASASAPMYRPTMIVSAIIKIYCRRFPTIIGMENSNSVFKIFPSVSWICLLFMQLFLIRSLSVMSSPHTFHNLHIRKNSFK